METKNNIAITNTFNNSVYFKAMCDCGANNHIHTIELCRGDEENYRDIELHLYANVCYDYWDELCDSLDPWYIKIYKKSCDYSRRIRKAIKLIFTGELEAEEYFIFSSEAQIRDYLSALEEGLTFLKSGEEDGKKRN